MEFIAGIDGGGTKTTLLIGKPDGSLVARHTLGAFNINSIGESGFSHLLQEFMTIFKDYGRCLHLTIGAAGISNTTMQKLVHEVFDKEDIAFDLVGDHIIALEGAHGGDAGLAVIAGTGSICFGKGLNGTIERCGGWGHLIGDEGSAYGLGRDALNAVAKDMDGYGAKTLITSLFAEEKQLTTRESIVSFVYSGDKASVASLAPLVCKAYEKKDDVASRILKTNACSLTQALSGVRQKLKLKEANVAFFGGLLDKDTPFRSEMLEAMAKTDQALVYRESLFDAATGALMLARKQIGKEDRT